MVDAFYRTCRRFTTPTIAVTGSFGQVSRKEDDDDDKDDQEGDAWCKENERTSIEEKALSFTFQKFDNHCGQGPVSGHVAWLPATFSV